MDIYQIICDMLQADTCPVYTPSDAQHDADALALALGLSPEFTDKQRSSDAEYYNETSAAEKLFVTKKEWGCSMQESQESRSKPESQDAALMCYWCSANDLGHLWGGGRLC